MASYQLNSCNLIFYTILAKLNTIFQFYLFISVKINPSQLRLNKRADASNMIVNCQLIYSFKLTQQVGYIKFQAGSLNFLQNCDKVYMLLPHSATWQWGLTWSDLLIFAGEIVAEFNL